MGNNLFQKYAVIWLICLAAFNVVCFVPPTEIDSVSRLTGSFWTSYVFITIAFIGQLACAWFALKADSLTKLFYNTPLITISYTGLVLMLVFGSVFMVFPSLPRWLGVILCFLVLAFTAITVIKANTAAELVQNTDEKIRTKTSTMRELTAQAESLIYQAKSEEARVECQKVYEALRYSDPMSNPALSGIEEMIFTEIGKFFSAVHTNDTEKIIKIGNSLELLISNRNTKCKMVK